jgi:hypothetical protein
MNNDLNLNSVDTLGALLAQIADLTAQADAIKNNIKDLGSLNKLPTKLNSKGKPVQFMEGALFSATYVGCDKTLFDKDAFIKVHGADAYAKFTKTTAVYSVKVTSR